ncbi:methyl-accepting chemotaxis protein [Geomonas subterranea]|uniref:Methyl-accepting chemotaxis protein n=1 Tax=Geomonas subterranea TaxID=2847989 RepID=A0ABX8LH39_9BACT|nr:methyl-accepting chemotaxis protein [Geomonas subterranea]QXE90226.1 methyl-accepting chemotaxis protein [Geomonas subterranea]QXM07649.1 methyl-accepting chemotaxis protein [Geomonas subterranea]
MATIRAKIIANLLVMLITIAFIVTLEFRAIATLGSMQDEGAQRSDAALLVKEASMGGLALYRIIADAEINGNLEQVSKDWQARKGEVLKSLGDAAAKADTAEEKRLVAEVQEATGSVIRSFEEKMLPLLKAPGDNNMQIKQLDSEIDLQVGKIETEMDTVTGSLVKEMRQADGDFDAERKRALTGAVIIGLAGALLQAALGIMLLRAIMGSVNAMRELLTSVSAGDLTCRAVINSQDELARTAEDFNDFVQKLQGMVRQISENSQQVVAESGRLSSSSEKIAAAAEEVAQQSTTVATAGEEMSATSGDISQNCQRASEGANLATAAAQDGAQVVERTVTVMADIAAKVRESAQVVASLGERSDQIGAIIVTIDEIADQTNLLALNAAIEAARAGEQGRGFAVVADEVRALAERTTRATREIDEMIKAIQKETRDAVAVMERGVEQVTAGTAEATRSGEALRAILDQVHDVAMQVDQVATAAEEQTATTEEISGSMQQITRIVQQTASGAHESAEAAHQLHGNAEELQQMVGQFRV